MGGCKRYSSYVYALLGQRILTARTGSRTKFSAQNGSRSRKHERLLEPTYCLGRICMYVCFIYIMQGPLKRKKYKAS